MKTPHLFEPLPPGGRLGLAWPASPAGEEELRTGLDIVRELGYVIDWQTVREGPLAYLAGSDRERAEELTRLMVHEPVAGVLAARGGYGCLRMAGLLDFDRLAAAGKPLVGFSDVTVLLSGLLSAGLCSIHGPSLSSLAEQSSGYLERWSSLLSGGWESSEPLVGRPVLGKGRVRGFLVGGNLTVLAHLVGTPWQPPLAGGLLFLEDIGEKLYRLDRALTHLLTAGLLERVRAVALGRFQGADYEAVLEMVRDRLAPLDLPVMAGLPFGHGPDNASLVVGGEAEMDLESGLLRPLPATDES